MAFEIVHKKTTFQPNKVSIPLAVLQVIGTCFILAFIPGNISKLISFLLFWAITFGPLNRHEVIIALLVNVLFTFMNINALTRGIFAFTKPDFNSLLPVWELFMWGFYVIHSLRVLGGSHPLTADLKKPTAVLCAIIFSAPFGMILNQHVLFITALSLLLLSFVMFHERMDLVYAGYFVLLGAIIEYTGVYSGQWYYPAQPYTGVPLWFATMWGGIGLFVRRILG